MSDAAQLSAILSRVCVRLVGASALTGRRLTLVDLAAYDRDVATQLAQLVEAGERRGFMYLADLSTSATFAWFVRDLDAEPLARVLIVEPGVSDDDGAGGASGCN